MGLPASGIISASQIGGYVFDRSATAIFSISTSLSPNGSVIKGYSTVLPGGYIWVGSGASDTQNPQAYTVGVNNLSLSDWYDYYKGQEINIGGLAWDTSIEACDDASEGGAYTTDYPWWGANNGILGNISLVYSDSSGETLFDDGGQWRACYNINNDVGIKYTGRFENGIYIDPGRCD
jgi:hypothetical protein